MIRAVRLICCLSFLLHTKTSLGDSDSRYIPAWTYEASNVNLSPTLGCNIGNNISSSKNCRKTLLANVDNATICLDAISGALVWRHDSIGPAICSPLLATVALQGTKTDAVFIGTITGAVVALDARSGRVLWERNLSGPVLNPPALAGRTVVITSGNSAHGLDAISGAILWTYAAQDDMDATAAVSADGANVFVGSEDGFLVSLDTKTGKKLWSLGLQFSLFGIQRTPVVHGQGLEQVLYVGPETGSEVFKVNASTGTLMWTFVSERQANARPGSISSELLFLNNSLFFTAIFPEDHPPGPLGLWFTAYHLNASSGRTIWNVSRPTGLWQWTVPSRPPVVTAQYMVVAAEDGIVECYNRQTGSLIWRQTSSKPGGANVLLPLLGEEAVLLFNGMAAEARDLATGDRQWIQPLIGISRAPFAMLQSPATLFLAGADTILALQEKHSAVVPSGNRDSLVG